MSIKIISECSAKEESDTKDMTRHSKPVLGKRREQNNNQDRNDENSQERQTVGKIHTGKPRSVAREQTNESS